MLFCDCDEVFDKSYHAKLPNQRISSNCKIGIDIRSLNGTHAMRSHAIIACNATCDDIILQV